MTTPIDENNKREDSNEDEYKPFPVDSEEMVDNTINHTFGEPEKLIGELVSNSIDARASKIQTMLDERRLSIGVSDNGTGILNIGKFITFGGSGRKEEKKDLEPGEALIGIFGEGLKAVLKICKSMTYKSCNGEFDVYAHLRNKGKNGFDQKIEKHPLHSQRQDIGTEVVCEGIDAINFYKVKERFEGDIGEAHAWRIGSKVIQISVGTIDKNGIKNVFIVDVPARMAGFFKDFAGQRLILNHNPRIEGIFLEGGNKTSERKVFWCCNYVTMKAEDTQYNVHCILNSNELIPNKNKTDYMEDNVSDRIELIVEDYISKHFPKSDWIQQLKPKNKKVFHTIMSVANKLAELRGLHARFNPIIPNPGSGTKIHLSNNQDLENPEYLNTNSTNPNVKQIETPTILWQWKKGKRTKKGTEEGGKAPEGEKGSTGGTNKVDTSIPERDLLVRTKQTIKGKTYDVLQVQTIKPDMRNEKSFFTILFTDNEENHRVSWSTLQAGGGAIIWVNIATYFCKLHEIKEEKNYDSTIILPHIVQSIEEVLNPPNAKIPISYEQHIQEQSNILNEMSAALWDNDDSVVPVK